MAHVFAHMTERQRDRETKRQRDGETKGRRDRETERQIKKTCKTIIAEHLSNNFFYIKARSLNHSFS